MANYSITKHAQEEAQRRNIGIEIVDAVLSTPMQIVDEYNRRKAYQSLVEIDGKLYLVRVIVEETDPITVITVYRTSKIDKYWSNES
jgi:hypothetical protein